MTPHPRAELLAGARDTLPLIVGAIPFGIIYGALGIASGLSAAAVLGMSLIVFAGSAQFVAVGLVASGAVVPLIILTTFVVNARHMLYAVSLAPYMAHLPGRWLVALGFGLTDETYAVVIQRYSARQGGEGQGWYHLGSALAMYSNWQVCTLIGILAGTQLEDIADWGLDFAMVVTFIGIVVPLVKGRAMLACAVVAAGVAVLAADLPNQAGIMLAAVAGIAAGLLFDGQRDGHHAP